MAGVTPLAAASEAHAAPDKGARVGFAADAQEVGERPGFRQLIRHFEAANATLLLYGGDTNYDWRKPPPDWVDALGPYAEPGRTLFVTGNHDDGPAYDPFRPPGAEATWWVTEVGGVTLVGLDTELSLDHDSEQMRWLEATLAEREENETVVLMMHIPWWLPVPYRDPGHRFPGNADRMDALVRAHDVDLVLAGHEHYYARTTLHGAPHVVAGPAEAKMRDVPAPVRDSADFSAKVQTGILLDLSPCGVQGQVISPEGRLLDRFAAPTVPESGSDPMPLANGLTCMPGVPEPRPAAAEGSPPADPGTAPQGDAPLDIQWPAFTTGLLAAVAIAALAGAFRRSSR